MIQIQKKQTKLTSLRIGITGARGALAKALIKKLRSKGAYVIGISHTNETNEDTSETSPNEWLLWECGKEEKLDKTLLKLDILILNHGINPKGKISAIDLNEALEVNALSSWRIIERFENLGNNQDLISTPREIWINTSEAEIMPALSPGYEISKRLIGQLVSLKWSSKEKNNSSNVILRKLILGPFKSKLNPIGIMSPELVANQILKQVELNLKLIIVTPNPLTYLIVPLNELIRFIYFKILKD